MKAFNFTLLPILCMLVLVHNMIRCEAQLSSTFYATTCPTATTIIRNSIRRAVSAERADGGLPRSPSFPRLLRPGLRCIYLTGRDFYHPKGFEVIEAAKLEVERACPGVVSCADILTLAARDAAVAVGATSWNVRLGRRDSTTASRSQANSDLPPPTATLAALTLAFSNKGLTPAEMVALSGELHNIIKCINQFICI
ncbi:hypothetical protein ACS0TY_008470 [Phlomoides rotata]